MAANPNVNGHELANLAPTGANMPTPTTAATSTQNLLPVSDNALASGTSEASTTSTTPPQGSIPPQSAANQASTPSPPAPRPSVLTTARTKIHICLTYFSELLAPVSRYFAPLSTPLKYFAKPLLSLTIYVLTVYTASTSPSRISPLGRVPPEWGIWILAILGKAGDISFAFAVEDAFDTFAWRKLRKRTRVNSPVGLVWWTSLLSSTGFEPLVKIVGRGLRRAVRKWWRGWREGWGITGSEWWSDWTDARWGLVRLACLVLLVPGPGIILLANISPKTVCVPTLTLDVTGGVAHFDPRIAEAYSTVSGTLVTKLIQNSLRDRTMTWPIDTYSSECKKGKACEAYLLAGPYRTTRPWPFRNETEKEKDYGFLLERAPVVMVELWDFFGNEGQLEDEKFDQTKECVLYGGFDQKHDYSFWVCIGDRGVDGELVATWFSCQEGYASNGTCLRPAALPGFHSWKQHIRFYRRTTNLAFSRIDFTILFASKLSKPVPQHISAADLFRALNSVLYRPNRSENDFRYDRNSQRYRLTQDIGSELWFSLFENARGTTLGRDWLRNALTMPLYVFQPLSYFIDTSGVSVINGTDPQPGISDENRLRGSYCNVANRSVPGRGTVIAYTSVAALVVALVFMVKARAWRWEPVTTKGVLMVDFEALTEVVVKRGRHYDAVTLGERVREDNVWEGMEELQIRVA